MSRLYRLARPFLFTIEAEAAHRLALLALNGPVRRFPPVADPRLRQRLLGLDFPNPVGMAAGFDKNAAAPDGVLALGFGFTEVGTVTPRPQSGNPAPRVFRLPQDRAIINRLGFNNEGFDVAHDRLAARHARPGIVGVNVGANRDSADRISDFVAGIARFSDVAAYITINVSSPNTPGLRDLQEEDALRTLLERAVRGRNDAARQGRSVPLLLKIAPDLDDDALRAIGSIAIAEGVDGIIVSNTTLARGTLRDIHVAKEAGGLSGRPLFRSSTVMLAKLRQFVGRKLVLVGVGGIDSAETAFDKIVAGADLVQLYTGLVYSGPGLVADILDGLRLRLDRDGFRSIADAVGTATDRWAAA